MSDIKSFKIFRCVSCSHAWLGNRSVCPICNGFGKSDEPDMTKKVVDDSDMKKAL